MARALPSKKQRSRAHQTQARVPMSGRLPTELLTAGVPLDADLELERQQRLEALKGRLAKMFAEGRGAEALDQVMNAMAGLERANERLAWRVLRANRYRFGRRTEKLSRDELHQLLLAFGGDEPTPPPDTEPAVPAPSEPEQVDDLVATGETEPTSAASDGVEKKTKQKRRRVRAMKVGPNVERNVTVVPVPKEECTCSLCGAEMKAFGHVDHELFRYVPAKIVVDVGGQEKQSRPLRRPGDQVLQTRPGRPPPVPAVSAPGLSRQRRGFPV